VLLSVRQYLFKNCNSVTSQHKLAKFWMNLLNVCETCIGMSFQSIFGNVDTSNKMSDKSLSVFYAGNKLPVPCAFSRFLTIHMLYRPFQIAYCITFSPLHAL
jgi:hypothetical protein